MNLRQYIGFLNELATENPEALDMPVVTSIDDEGNGFNDVNYKPALGEFAAGEFDAESDSPNAVCLN